MAKHDFLYKGVRKDAEVVALLDGDIIAVKAAAVFDAQDGHEEEHLELIIRMILRQWVRACGVYEYRICMSLGKSFRYNAYPEYKSNRTGILPRGAAEAKEYLRKTYNVLEYDSLEADDVMGILATEPQCAEVRLIVSTDKDMLQIPAWQFNPDKDRWPHKPSSLDAFNFLCYQWLCGDTGDGYKGIPGYGVSRFRSALESCFGEMDEFAVSLIYASKQQTDEYMMSQFKCASILQWANRPEGWNISV